MSLTDEFNEPRAQLKYGKTKPRAGSRSLDFENYRPLIHKAATKIKTLPDEPAPLMINLIELKDYHCRWPFGDDVIFFYGHTKERDSSYCLYHKRRSTS